MTSQDRVRFTPVAGVSDLFTTEFCEYLSSLHDKFTPRVHELRAKRVEVLDQALNHAKLPDHLPTSEINTGDWQTPEPPEELMRPGIEISGPASLTAMFINALNPGPEGERAVGDLDDDEDSGGHRFEDTVAAALNRLHAVQRTLSFHNPERQRDYFIQEGEIPFFMHRERGLHLDEPDVTIDGQPIPATILGTALTIYHAGRAQIERGQGVYFYLPKMESAEEAALYRDIFDASFQSLDLPDAAVIRAIPLVESLPAVYQMEEMLYALGPYAAGLNAARWDLKASILEFVMADPNSVWPDRFGVDIKTTPFLGNIFRRLVAVCLKRGGAPIGGMATALPARDDETNRAAAETIKNDKVWEAEQGFLRAWVAHIFHMKTAADPFRELRATGWQPTPEMGDPDNYPVSIDVPEGPVTMEGTRRNARMIIEYLEGWLNGRGAKGIDSLAGRPGIHPPLMEDLATGRISVAQVAQRIIHQTVAQDTEGVHDLPTVRRILLDEMGDILDQAKRSLPSDDLDAQQAFREAEVGYRKATKIALRWIKNYTEFNFRSLGSYTRADLEAIAAAPDAF